MAQGVGSGQWIDAGTFFGSDKNRLDAALAVCSAVGPFEQPVNRAVYVEIFPKQGFCLVGHNGTAIFFTLAVANKNAERVMLNEVKHLKKK